MAKIKIAGVSTNGDMYNVNVVLTETRKIEDEDQEVPIGECTVSFPADTEMADIKTKIQDAAQQIKKAADNAKNKRVDIEELDFPEVV